MGPGLWFLWKALAVLSVGGKTKYGHVGDFSPLTTLVGKQELEQAPDSAPFQQLEELYSGSDPDDVLG